MSLLWRLKEIKEWMKGLNGLKLDEGIVIEIIEKFWEKIVIEKIMVGDLEKLMCLVVEKIGMEYKGGDERKEVIIGDRVEMKRERLNKKLDISERNENWKIWRIIKRIGEIEKKLLENEWKCVGEGGGVKRKKGRDKIVIEERENENEREEEENNGKIGGGEKEDWEMELLRNKVERIGLGKELMKMDVVGKKIGIKVGEEVNEGEIGRKLLNVNGRNGWRKRGENGIRRKEFMVFNWENLSWKGNIREMNVWIGGKMNGLWWKCII